MLRHTVFVAIVVGLWLLSGCGGGGGNGGGSGGGSGAHLAPGQYIEFLDANGNWMDPFNLQPGAAGTAVIANYDSLGNRTVLASSNWGTTAGSGFVSINSSSGVFSVIATTAGEFKFQGFATIAGNPTLFEQRGRVPSATPIVNGRFTEINQFTGLPGNTGIPHLNVDFYNSGGTLVGSARTMKDGRLTARIPTTATHMMIEAASIRGSWYYKSIYYNGGTYSPLDTGCLISIGTVGSGTTNLLTGGIPIVSGTPPPPPTGCT